MTTTVHQDRFCSFVQGIRGKTIAGMLAAAAFFGLLSAAACGCQGTTPNNPSNITLTAQQVARATVLSAESAWVESDKACKAVAQAKGDDTIRQHCAAVLDPLVPGISAAAHAVDAWTDASQGQLACFAGDMMAAWPKVEAIMQSAGVTIPPVIADLISFAGALAPQCTASDAGPAPSASTSLNTESVDRANQSVDTATTLAAIVGAIQ